MSTSESGTNQPTGSEAQREGNSNDGTVAAITRAETFIHGLLSKLEGWLHIGEVSDASVQGSEALAHLAEAKAMANGEQPSGAVAAAGLQADAPAEDKAAESNEGEKGTAETPAQ